MSDDDVKNALLRQLKQNPADRFLIQWIARLEDHVTPTRIVRMPKSITKVIPLSSFMLSPESYGLRYCKKCGGIKERTRHECIDNPLMKTVILRCDIADLFKPQKTRSIDEILNDPRILSLKDD